MNKMILFSGIALFALGVGFLTVGLNDYTLSSAYTIGGYLWMVIGGVILGLGLKVNRSKQQLGAMR